MKYILFLPLSTEYEAHVILCKQMLASRDIFLWTIVHMITIYKIFNAFGSFHLRKIEFGQINICSTTFISKCTFVPNISTQYWLPFHYRGNQIWTGLFVYDKTSSAVIMKMQGICQIYEYLNEYSPWDSDTPSTSNLDFTKRCVVLKSKDLTFILEKCSQGYSFICQVNMGKI